MIASSQISKSLRILVAAMVISSLAEAAPYRLEFGSKGNEEVELRLPVGKSQIIRATDALDQVVIGNPEVADIKLLSSKQVLILGIKPGHTNLVFKNKRRDLVALMDVVVGYDLSGIKRKLYEVMPEEAGIEVRGSNDSVIMSGKISNTYAMEKALAVARSYVPAKNVINLLQVGGGHQVMLEVKISEVARASLKELGIETLFGNDGVAVTTVVTGAPAVNAFGLVDFVDIGGSAADFLNLRLTALEQKGLARTLAEPNLVALSGQEANFLAGGEIPIPVAQAENSGAVTIEFKEFGVGLNFTPTVLSSDQINLKLQTEVSSIDDSRSFSLGGGLAIPSINTRRMSSTIEMGDGQSFAIAGLLESNLIESIRQFPWLGDLPILGALFRSNSFNREETELVIVVTPRLVKPVRQGTVSLPTDNIVPPSQLDWYLLGGMEGNRDYRFWKTWFSKSGSASKNTNVNVSGFEGAVGHE